MTGKTFTMQGEHANSGIIPRSLDTVFNTIGSKISETVPVQPVGFNRVVSINNAELDQLRRDKEAVFKLGIDLSKKSGRASPDSSMLSGCSAASTGDKMFCKCHIYIPFPKNFMRFNFYHQYYFPGDFNVFL